MSILMHKPKITNSITELHIGYVPDKSVTSVTDGPKMQTFFTLQDRQYYEYIHKLIQ